MSLGAFWHSTVDMGSHTVSLHVTPVTVTPDESEHTPTMSVLLDFCVCMFSIGLCSNYIK